MRQGQQNRRGRSRGRKPQSPLSRNFESNGPDVKIRGTAAHIAEKYNSLARDALASGDLVQAENYLQHAEHYNRIIMAAQPNHGAGMEANGQHRARRPGEPGYSADDDYDDDMDGDDEPAMEHIPGRSEQPVVHEGYSHARATGAGGTREQATEHAEHTRTDDRGERQDRGDRPRQRRARSHSRPRTHEGEANGEAPAVTTGESVQS